MIVLKLLSRLPFRTPLALSIAAALLLLSSCETTTKERSDYTVSDGKTDSIIDSRIKQLSEEAIKYPLRADLHYQIASLHAKKGDCIESARALERAIAIAPDDAKYHFHLGRLYLNMNDLDNAEASFRKSLDLSQKGRFTGPHAALGWTLSLKKDQAGALEHFQKCIEIDPENPTFYYFVGSLNDMQGNKEAAVRSFREYLARGGQTYRKKATQILLSLGVKPADIPEGPLGSPNEDIFSGPPESDTKR